MWESHIELPSLQLLIIQLKLSESLNYQNSCSGEASPWKISHRMTEIANLNDLKYLASFPHLTVGENEVVLKKEMSSMSYTYLVAELELGSRFLTLNLVLLQYSQETIKIRN